MNTKARSRGYSSVFIAITLAIALALLTSFIVISMPLAKSYVDKTHWAGEMSIYKPPNPINATGGQPQFNGYCLVNTIGNMTYTTCPSTVGNVTMTKGATGMGMGMGMGMQPPQPPPSPTQPITVYVQDPYGAGWLITWSGSASGSKSGSGSATWQISTNGAISLGARITSNPLFYTCSISPPYAIATPGNTVTFTVTCKLW